MISAAAAIWENRTVCLLPSLMLSSLSWNLILCGLANRDVCLLNQFSILHILWPWSPWCISQWSEFILTKLPYFHIASLIHCLGLVIRIYSWVADRTMTPLSVVLLLIPIGCITIFIITTIPIGYVRIIRIRWLILQLNISIIFFRIGLIFVFTANFYFLFRFFIFVTKAHHESNESNDR